MLVRDADHDQVRRGLRSERGRGRRPRRRGTPGRRVRSVEPSTAGRRRRGSPRGRRRRPSRRSGPVPSTRSRVVRSGSRRARLAGATPVSRSNTRKASARPSSSRAAPSGRAGADAQVRHDRSALLGHAGLVDARHLQPVEVGRGREHLADGDDAGATDAGDEERRAVGPTGLGQRRRLGARPSTVPPSPPCVAWGDGHERRAVTLDAAHVEVARVLVDARLAAERRVHRVHAQAVRDVAAVAAALAHRLVDHHARRRVSARARACARGAARRRTPGRRSSAVTPGTSRSSRWTASRSLAPVHLHARARSRRGRP